MKVCMLVLNKFTHDTRVLKEARTLVEAGYHVTVWALGNGKQPSHEQRDGFTVKRWSSRVAKWPWRPPGLMLAEQIITLAQRLARERADVYHAHDANALLPVYLAARSTNAPLIYDSHEFLKGLSKNQVVSRLRLTVQKAIERLVIRQAEGVITVNPSIAHKLNAIYKVHPVVLMNVQPLTEVQSTGILRETLGVGQERRIAIYAASFKPGRGLETLIESAEYLDKEIIIVLMGPDGMNGKLQQYAAQLNVDSRVKFLPPVPQEEVTRYVKDADIGVIATQSNSLNSYYGLGNKIFHYIAAGIPVAVSNQPERRRIVESYNLGVVFDETNPKDIASKINQTLKDPMRYQQLRRNVLQAHQEELNWEKESRKLVSLYAKITGAHSQNGVSE